MVSLLKPKHSKNFSVSFCSSSFFISPVGPHISFLHSSLFPSFLFSFQNLSSVQLLSRVQLFATPMDWASKPGFPVHHQLPESTQTHVHWAGNAIRPAHPLSSPSPPALNLSQFQGLFKWVTSSHQVAKVLELQLQHQSFQWIPRTDLL